jgi:hypothetical protein
MIAFWWGTGDWNIGCCTGGGVVVVDLDQKNDQDGIGAYMERGGTFGTLAVRTTTGGMHLYFAGDGRNSAGKVAPGIDLRGEGGYVVAPGSTIDGVAYELVSDKPLAPLPAWVAEAARQRATVAASAPLTELDTPRRWPALRCGWRASARRSRARAATLTPTRWLASFGTAASPRH